MIFVVGFGGYFSVLNAQTDLQKKFQKNGAKAKSNWNGKWTRASRFYNAEIKIKSISPTQINFELVALNGANSGEIKGKAKIRGNMAFFDDQQPKNNSGEENCQILMNVKNSNISIDTSKGCEGYGGLGVNFEGEYEKGNGKTAETDFVYLKVFPGKILDDKFKKLVGVPEYENFLNAFQLINEEEDLDGFNAKVFSACVRGICISATGIIMFNSSGEIWAAVADDKYPKDYFVKYYTNVAAWRGKLPKTVETWTNQKKSDNQRLTVIYKSK